MILSKDTLPIFVYEEESFSGVKKVADYVRRDMSLVFGKEPEKFTTADGNYENYANYANCNAAANSDNGVVIFGTLGKSPVIEKLAADGTINTENIAGKREVYLFQVVKDLSLHNSAAHNTSLHNSDVLIIAGSDKRGTIYGLLHLSKLLGVSPFVDWSDLKPRKLERLELTDEVNVTSKEPSVKYRGFFINDEWPAFGNFATKRFGGINAKLYEVIFMMLLRMNGNYLWPAMWNSCFAEEGPGLLSAELADELGVVMGLSHHEPCLRHGEEYTHVRGKDSIYGDAWNFLTNREGITRFWRDGLKRNGHLENVITIGMRGERDSTIMGKEATLADNINLLRDVIRTQNELIKEEVNPDLTKVPRMLALYKEVEPFFFGDETTPGLMGDECLDDVILLLCDDNHGYLRSRPISFCENDTEKSEKAGRYVPKGNNGYGLYYHFDYHGDPISFEWVNSTYLPEVWEELTESYETGIRDLYIVNVGDVGFNELSLNYFMDFCYDYDKWGINHVCKMDEPDVAYEYLVKWFKHNFAGSFKEDDYETLARIWTGTSRLIHTRRPEHMDADVYSAKDFSRTLEILNEIKEMLGALDTVESHCKINNDAFFQLISFQIRASLNLVKMWIYKSFNRQAASKGMNITNYIADKLEETFDVDKELTEKVHSINNGLYWGLALAYHIGFKHWNDEESAYPSTERIRILKRADIVAGVDGLLDTTTGQYWSGKTLRISKNQEKKFYIALSGSESVKYHIEYDEGLVLSKTEGELTAEKPYEIIEFKLSDKAVSSYEDKKYAIHVISKDHDIEIEYEDMVSGYMIRDAALYNSIGLCNGETIYKLDRVGNTNNGIRLSIENKDGSVSVHTKAPLPLDKVNESQNELSYAAYDFEINEDSIYRLTFTFLPCNPRMAGDPLHFGYMIENANDNKKTPELKMLTILKPDHAPGLSDDWCKCVITHERDVTALVELKEGKNTLRYYPYQAENVLLRFTVEKIMSL